MRADLNQGIGKAKRAHSQKIVIYFQVSKDTRQLWQGIKSIMSQLQSNLMVTQTSQKAWTITLVFLMDTITHPPWKPPPSRFSVWMWQVSVVPWNASVNKSCSSWQHACLSAGGVYGPAGLCYGKYIQHPTVPGRCILLLQAAIIPILKTSTFTCLNNYWPVALMPMMMKCFEQHFLTVISIPWSPPVCLPTTSLCTGHFWTWSIWRNSTSMSVGEGREV